MLEAATLTVALEYDNDDLVTRVGDLRLARDAYAGLLTSATVGSVGTAFQYNAFAEPTTVTAAFGAETSVASSRSPRMTSGRSPGGDVCVS